MSLVRALTQLLCLGRLLVACVLICWQWLAKNQERNVHLLAQLLQCHCRTGLAVHVLESVNGQAGIGRPLRGLH